MRNRALALLPVAALAAACAGTAPTPSPASHTAGATLSEFKIALDTPVLASGDDTFALTNKGTITHEFVIVQTDVADAGMPTGADGTVDEENAELKHITEEEDIAAGSTVSLAASLPPGHYVYFCNLPGHYAGGMHGTFTVSS